MKLLVLGIDGGERTILEAMPMPHLQRLMRDSRLHDAKVDTWSRGWSEIYTGLHGMDTGGLYNKPVCNGQYAFTERYNLDTLREVNPHARPVWDDLSAKGHRVGIMNIPTTMPAPRVNGFFVSGVGGGSAKNGAADLPVGACFPDTVAGELQRMGYVTDFRVAASGVTDIGVIFDNIEQMEVKRTECFVELARQHRIDFGFVAYMGIKSISYLLNADILSLIERCMQPSSTMDNRLLSFFSKMDELYHQLLEQLQPEATLLVSDHGMAPYLKNVNLNAFLMEQKWQTPNRSTSGWVRSIGKSVKQLLPGGISRSLGRRAPGMREFVGRPNFDLKESKAFGINYIPGVFVNDVRFGGGHDASDRFLLDEIVESFNRHADANGEGMRAEIYRAKHQGANGARFLPDIWIHHADTIYFRRQGPFVSGNSTYKPFTSFADLVSDMNSGIKGEKPLLYLHGAQPDGALGDGKDDLTLANVIIRACMR